jgi:hypothetical protein
MANTESKGSKEKKQLALSKSQLAKPKSENQQQKTKHHKPHRSKFSSWRRAGQNSYRVEDVRGKTVDLVEFYTTGGFHCLDVRFEDKTSLTFTIDPGFTIEAAHSDWTTGNMKRLQEWPEVRAAGF